MRWYVEHRKEVADRSASVGTAAHIARSLWLELGRLAAQRLGRDPQPVQGLGGSPVHGSPWTRDRRSPGGRVRKVLEPDSPFTLIASWGE